MVWVACPHSASVRVPQELFVVEASSETYLLWVDLASTLVTSIYPIE